MADNVQFIGPREGAGGGGGQGGHQPRPAAGSSLGAEFPPAAPGAPNDDDFTADDDIPF